MSNAIITDEAREVLSRWWHQLQSPAARAERAILRRCHTPGEVCELEHFWKFRQRLPELFGSERDILALGAVIGLYSHVKDLDSRKFFVQLGARVDGDTPLLSELRFRQIQTAETLNDLYRHLRRCIDLSRKRANIVSLAEEVFRWARFRANAVSPSQSVQFVWADQYFGSYFGLKSMEKSAAKDLK